MPKIKLECSHVDTCLPDYWSGHHLPHVYNNDCVEAVYAYFVFVEID